TSSSLAVMPSTAASGSPARSPANWLLVTGPGTSTRCSYSTPGWHLADDSVPEELLTPQVVVVDLLAGGTGGGHPLFTLVRARDRAGKVTALIASQPAAEARQQHFRYSSARWSASSKPSVSIASVL